MSAQPCRTSTQFVARVEHDQVGTILVALWLTLAIVVLRAADAAHPATPPPTSPDTVDPNTAPWWELTALPEIGEGTAREIIAYRSAGLSAGETFQPRRFNRASDLERVRGIGPKTVERIAPYLRFGD